MRVVFISFCALGALLSSFDFVNAVATPRDTPSFTMPLRHRAAAVSTLNNFDKLEAMAHRLRQKYNYSPRSLDRRQGTGVVPITDEHSDSSYSGEITIGTPGQTFGVILDSGSSDLWVASTSCTSGCQGVKSYNPTGSSSFKNQNQQVSITYGSGAVEGILSTDTVSLGGFSAPQNFLVASRVTSGLLDENLSGLLGLGFKSIANTGATPFVQALSSSSLTAPLMSVYLARLIDDQSAQATEPGGTLTLGATNSSLFQGDIDFVDIPSTVTPGFWLLPTTGITVQGSAISVPSGSTPNSQLAAIDTGTTLIGGPSDAVAAIYDKIPGAQNGTGQLQGYYTYPCDTQVNVAMTFGGTKSWPINPVDFQLQAQGNDGSLVCIGAIFDLEAGSSTSVGGPPRKRQASTSNNPAWIVGDSFLKNVYTVFRFEPPSVGFAQLSSSLPGAGPAPGPATSGGLNSGGQTSTAMPFPTSAVRGTSANALPSSSAPSGPKNGAQSLGLRAIDLASMIGLAGAIVGVSHVWC